MTITKLLQSVDMSMEKKNIKEEEPVSTIYEFTCSECNINEKAQYKGTTPPFSRNIALKYPSYLMKDPFSPPGKGEILVLGSDCALCNKQVCISKDCSLFYIKLYCLKCVKEHLEMFPSEIKSKVSQINKNK